MGHLRFVMASLIAASLLTHLTVSFNMKNFKFSRTPAGGRKVVYKTEHSGLRGMIELVPVVFMVWTSLSASQSETEASNAGENGANTASNDRQNTNTPLENLMNKRNDVIGFNSDTLPPRRTKRKMAFPFQAFDAPLLLDGTLGTYSAVLVGSDHSSMVVHVTANQTDESVDVSRHHFITEAV